MKKWILSTFCFLATLAAENISTGENFSNSIDIQKISETFGHLIAKNLDAVGDESGVKFDLAQIIKGLQDASEGREAPMTETECIEAITTAQEMGMQKISIENLQKAEKFLKENENKEGVIILQEGKLQCKILKTGEGKATIDENCSPLLQYTGRLLHEKAPFGASKEAEVFHPQESIPGFWQGILGMKKGEVRELYIHPDLGYGTQGVLPRNSLLTFQVEVVEVNAPHVDQSDSLSTPSSKGNPEIVSPLEEEKFLR